MQIQHRVKSEDTMGLAQWNPSTKTASVMRVKGKFMSTMGYNNHLFPEEVVFLKDYDEIELLNERGEKMSKAQAFALLDECGIDMKVYSAYATLREQRFPTYRHGAWRLTSSSSSSSLRGGGGRALSIADLKIPRLGRVNFWMNTSTSTTVGDEGDRKRARGGEDEEEEEEDELPIAFDVYQPQSGFSKTKMDKPSFCIGVLGADDDMPSVEALRAAAEKVPENVPLRLCIVGDSSVTFVEVSKFDPKADSAKRIADVKNHAVATPRREGEEEAEEGEEEKKKT